MTERLEAPMAVELFEGADEWVAAVAARARCSAEHARLELARQRIRPPVGWGPQRHLRLNGMLFAGVKTPTDGTRTPYIFDISFAANVTALGTHSENDAGKSSVIKTLRWALRGRSQLQNDVRGWMRAVVLEMTVHNETLAVAFAVNSGEPAGAVRMLRRPIDFAQLRGGLEESVEALRTPPTASRGTEGNDVFAALDAYLDEHGAVVVAEFASSGDFERVMDDVMLERLGFPRVPSWQSRPSGQQTHDGDGSLGTMGWLTWSSALSITEPNVPVVLGEERFAVVRLLQMYLGSPWAITVSAIAAAKGQLGSQLGLLQRRLRDQQAAHTGDLGQLRERLRQVQAALDTQPAPDDLAALDRRIQAAAELGRAAAAAEVTYREVSLRYGDVSRLLDVAEAEVAALAEASLTRRFWHSLKPSCCPRCDTDVSEERWARERKGQCSLCDSPLLLDQAPASAEPGLTDAEIDSLLQGGERLDLDSMDDLSAAQLQVRQLAGQVEAVSAEQNRAKAARDDAKRAWQTAQAAVGGGEQMAVAQWQQLMIERAVIQARIDERLNVRPSAELEEQIELLKGMQKIIQAAEAVATARLKADQEQLLGLVSEQVAELGRKLGVRNLENVALAGNGHMPVVKGGARANFGDLEAGEKLRLKISLIVALMRIGEQAGVARHPGLIMIDSLGREELNPRDMINMLAELVKLTEEVPYLQVVLTSAYGDRLVEGLGEQRVLLAEPGKPLW